MKDFKNTDAFNFASIAFREFGKENLTEIEKLALLSELCKTAGFSIDPLLDYLNKEFVELLNKHDGDDRFDNPEHGQGYEPDDEPYLATIVNAYDELMTYDPTFSAAFDYWFDPDMFHNPWDVGIVRK